MKKTKIKFVIGTVTLFSAAVLAQTTLTPAQSTQAATMTGSYLKVSSKINSYIVNNNLNTPQITKELHEFSMFHYKTADQHPNGIVFHQTADPESFKAREGADYEINYGWQTAFVHTFIDASTILNIHDTDYGCWGAGPMANARFVQFELVTARNTREFAQSINNAAWYTAYICHLYNIPLTLASQHYGIGGIWTHNDVTRYLGGTDHTDPTGYLKQWGYTLPEFLDLVQAYTKTQHFPDTLSSQKTVDYTAVINQAGRNDGIFNNEPYNVVGASLAGYAKSYEGQALRAVAEATTQSGAWVKIQLPNGKYVWIDKRGVKKYDRIKSQKKVNYPAKVNQAGRKDMMFTDAPYNVVGAKKYDYASSVEGQILTASEEAVVGDTNVTWIKVQLANGTQVWLDKRGVHAYDELTNKHLEAYEAKITKTSPQDGLFTDQPYNVLGSSLYGLGTKFKNQDVQVQAEAEAGGTTWSLIKIGNGAIVWINKDCLTAYPHISDEETVNYAAKLANVSQQDGLFSTAPYTVRGSVLYAMGSKFANQDVDVLRVGFVGSTKWAYVTLANGQSVWVDAGCLIAYPNVSVTDNREYQAVINNAKANDAFFANGPYSTQGAEKSDSVTRHVGEIVSVKREAVVSGTPWVEVRLADGRLLWLDKRLVTEIPSLTLTSTDHAFAKVTQARKNDGIFENNPYGIIGAKLAGFAADYVGQTVEIQQTGELDGIEWDQIKLPSGVLVWIDAGCVSLYDQLTVTSTNSYQALIGSSKKNDGLFSEQPYGVYGSKLYGYATDHIGQTVTVLRQGKTAKGQWSYVKLTNGDQVWLDARLLTKPRN